jgi:uncharacterized protein (TIGR02145 family)
LPNPTISSNKSVAGKGGFDYTHSFGTIDPNNIQYARAYARTSAGVFYSPERSFTPIPGLRCPGTPSVTDIDGNLYHTVQIGNQCWTQSNLKVSKYRNGDAIPTGLSNTAWQNTTAGAYAIYDNNPVNDGLYGKLYNHYAVMDTRGVCPTGWHVPTDGEWNLLTIYLDPNSDTGCFYINNHYCAPSCQISSLLKSTVTQPSLGGWISSTYPNTNASGFSGLGAGYRNHDYFNGAYLDLNNVGFWCSSTLLPPYASGRDIIVGNNCIAKVKHDLRFGFSVRCLKDIVPSVLTAPVLGITATSATTGGDVTQDGGAPVTARGVAYGTSSSPTTAGAITNDGIGTGVFTSTLTGLTPFTTYNVRAYATNSVGTAYGNEVSFTTSPLVTIGMTYAGGIVFDVDSTGSHGLVCAFVDQGNLPWGCFNTTISQTSISVGSGANNTLQIVTRCNQNPIAASECANLILNGYSDWYLPSLGELQLMYNRLHLLGMGSFGVGINPWYWSSSEYDHGYAWGLNFGNGDANGPGNGKNNPNAIRAVRTF